MMIRALVAVVLASACTRDAAERGLQSTPPSPSVAPAPTRTPPPTSPPSPPALAKVSEVGPAAETTSRNAAVLAIGRPRFRLVPTCCDELVVRIGTKRVLVQDRSELKQWDLDGLLVERTVLSSDEVPLIQLVASADGVWVAAGEFATLGIYRAGARTSTMNYLHAHAFVGNGQVLAEDKDGPAVVDAATGTIVERLPKRPFPTGATLALGGDGEHVWWLTHRGFARWDKGGTTFAIVTPAAKEWTRGSIALRAPIAVVGRVDGLHRLDLASGALTAIAPRMSVFAVSPTGAWTALVDRQRVRVLDTSTGREVASVAVKQSVWRIAFAENDDVLAFDEDGTIRIADIASNKITVRPTAAPARFRGWEGDGVASIEHEGAVQQLDVATGAIGPARGTVQAPPVSPLVLALTDRTIVARANGKQVARLDVGAPPQPGPGLEQTYWKAVASPTGTAFAAWVRRPDVAPEAPPGESIHSERDPKCARDSRGDCIVEYVAELWSTDGDKPRMLWRVRPDGKRPQTSRTWPYPKSASGPIAFTSDGKYVLFGFNDGDVIVRATDASATSRIESLHRAPITRIEVAPGGNWVFTEDAEGEQRIWPL